MIGEAQTVPERQTWASVAVKEASFIPLLHIRISSITQWWKSTSSDDIYMVTDSNSSRMTVSNKDFFEKIEPYL